MLSKSVKRKLIAKRPPREGSIGRQIYFLYRYLSVWGDHRWPKLGSQPLGVSHIHLLATIGLDGVSNSEMARRAYVSKQAMSKSVREMLKHELIVIDPNEHDSRCNIISLTDKGAGMLMEIWETNKSLMTQFEKQLGKAKSKKLFTLMAELVELLDTTVSQPPLHTS
jgi:DNA-binding MarR family transcriptional regulator